MKRTIWLAGALMMALGIFGCSSSGPATSSTTITDDNPVTGQRILLRVIAETDNPPLRYVWNCPNGTFESSSHRIESGEVTDKYYVYWIPEAEGSYTVTCTVIDAKDDDETINFQITVEARQIIELWTPAVPYHGMILMAKDYYIKSGGIWAAIYNRNLYYYCSTGDNDLDWGKDFFDWSETNPLSALAITAYSSYYYAWNNIWAVRKHNGTWQMVSYYAEDEDTYSCTSDACDEINTVNAIGIHNSTLWVGTDAGLFTFGISSEDWDGPVEDITDSHTIPAVNDIYAANDLVYAATTAGIYYTSDGGDSWSSFNTPWDTTDITGFKDLDADEISIYARTNTATGYEIVKFSEDGVSSEVLDGQPTDEWISGLDSDPLGRIWFGKYFWDGSIWTSIPADPDTPATPYDDSSDPIVRSLVSPEGLTYLQTTSGALLVWGKYDD